LIARNSIVLLAFLIVVIGLAILFGAIRIILGWILPVATMKRVDAATNAIFIFIAKLFVVGLAVLIVWSIWFMMKGSTN